MRGCHKKNNCPSIYPNISVKMAILVEKRLIFCRVPTVGTRQKGEGKKEKRQAYLSHANRNGNHTSRPMILLAANISYLNLSF